MAAWAPTTSGESCVLEPSSALRYTGPGPLEQSHEKGRPPDYHGITVVMTGGTGFKTRSVRGNAGNTLKLDIDRNTHPAWTGVHRLVDSGGPLARSDKRFENFGLKGRGIPIV